MKKFLQATCLLMVWMLLPLPALAMSQAEWDQGCYSKIAGAATLYKISNESAATLEEAGLIVIGSLPSGAYVRLGTFNRQLRMWDIAYLKNGAQVSAWVMRDNVTDATKPVNFTDGTAVNLPEALVEDASALQAYVARQYPGKKLSGDGSTPVGTDETQPLESRATAEKASGASAKAGAEKTISSNIPLEMEEAAIYAPKGGTAPLRKKASEKGKLIKQCKAGTIVTVLDYGAKWTRIKDGKREGYIKTSSLTFLPANREPIALADLSWRGTTTGGTRINIRNEASKQSFVIGEWRTGTDVEVFSFKDGWYEVDAFGMHGFVMEEFIKIKEE